MKPGGPEGRGGWWWWWVEGRGGGAWGRGGNWIDETRQEPVKPGLELKSFLALFRALGDITAVMYDWALKPGTLYLYSSLTSVAAQSTLHPYIVR